MSNGARHGLGAVIGLVVTPLIAACLMYGSSRLALYMMAMGDMVDRLTPVAILLAGAVLLGLILGSRVSPLASIIPGLVFIVAGVLWVATPRTMMTSDILRELPNDLSRGFGTAGVNGLFLILGATLLVASLMPSRWKAATAGGPGPRHAAPGPYGPPPVRSDSPPPLPGPQQPAQPGQPGQHAQPASGQAPPWQAPSQPQYGQGAAPLPYDGGAQPSSGAPPLPPAGSQGGVQPSGAVPFGSDGPEKPARDSAGSSDESAGEWTQMYGGDDLRGRGGNPPA